MKNAIWIILLLAVFVSGCAAGPAAPASGAASLKVGDGKTSKAYTVEMLKSLPKAQASFKNVTYVGVKLSDLLANAGLDPKAAKAVKAVASDGFTVNYEPALFLKADTLVAYQIADGALAAEDGSFRMVLPDQEGKQNVRMLVELQAVP